MTHHLQLVAKTLMNVLIILAVQERFAKTFPDVSFVNVLVPSVATLTLTAAFQEKCQLNAVVLTPVLRVNNVCYMTGKMFACVHKDFCVAQKLGCAKI